MKQQPMPKPPEELAFAKAKNLLTYEQIVNGTLRLDKKNLYHSEPEVDVVTKEVLETLFQVSLNTEADRITGANQILRYTALREYGLEVVHGSHYAAIVPEFFGVRDRFKDAAEKWREKNAQPDLQKLLTMHPHADVLIWFYQGVISQKEVWSIAKTYHGYQNYLRPRETRFLDALKDCFEAVGFAKLDLPDISITLEENKREMEPTEEDRRKELIPIIDVMGTYDRKSRAITLHLHEIADAANKVNRVNPDICQNSDIFLIVLMHELGHFFMHNLQIGGRSLTQMQYDAFEPAIRESWAQFFAYYALFMIDEPEAPPAIKPEFQKIFEALLNDQPEDYNHFQQLFDPDWKLDEPPTPDRQTRLRQIGQKVAQSLQWLMAAEGEVTSEEWFKYIKS